MSFTNHRKSQPLLLFTLASLASNSESLFWFHLIQLQYFCFHLSIFSCLAKQKEEKSPSSSLPSFICVCVSVSMMTVTKWNWVCLSSGLWVLVKVSVIETCKNREYEERIVRKRNLKMSVDPSVLFLFDEWLNHRFWCCTQRALIANQSFFGQMHFLSFLPFTCSYISLLLTSFLFFPGFLSGGWKSEKSCTKSGFRMKGYEEGRRSGKGVNKSRRTSLP